MKGDVHFTDEVYTEFSRLNQALRGSLKVSTGSCRTEFLAFRGYGLSGFQCRIQGLEVSLLQDSGQILYGRSSPLGIIIMAGCPKSVQPLYTPTA